MLWLLSIIIASFVFILIARNSNSDNETHGGLFNFRFLFFRFLLWMRNVNSKRKANRLFYHDPTILRKWEQMETPQILSDSQPDLSDMMSFFAVAESGLLLRFGHIRRCGRCSDLYLIVRTADGRLLRSIYPSDTRRINCNPHAFTSDGLQLLCEGPMERWRIIYKGFVKENKSHNEDGTALSIDIRFRAYTNPIDLNSVVGNHLRAQAVAAGHLGLRTDPRSEAIDVEQWGLFTGRITVGSGDEEQVSLRGCRRHRFGERTLRDSSSASVSLQCYFQDGSSLHLGEEESVRFGYFCTPYGQKHLMTTQSLSLNSREDVADAEIKFTTNDQRFVLIQSPRSVSSEFRIGATLQKRLIIQIMKCKLNGRRGYGVLEFLKSADKEQEASVVRSHPLLEPVLQASHPGLFTVKFEDPDCRVTSVSGGKGVQLALLSSIAWNENVEVPPGFVVTTAAYSAFLAANSELKSTISQLSSQCQSLKTVEDLDVVCSSVRTLVETATLPSQLLEALEKEMEDVFTIIDVADRFAVRSSAVGEDGTAASGAGEMETLLGVPRNGVARALLTCWTSLFRTNAVAYRRDVGQTATPLMAVIVQRMVPADVAGVLFTCDPMSGDARNMRLDANFGLGESVVDASVEPDSFSVHRLPVSPRQDRFEITERRKGGKECRVEMADGIDGGTKEVEISVDEAAALSLSDTAVLRLAEIGWDLECRFGSPRDMEWAMVKDKIFLLQSRPVTTISGMQSDMNWQHELDSGFSYAKEVISTANVSEMMPMAVTPLTHSLFPRAVGILVERSVIACQLRDEHTFPLRIVLSCGNHLFINFHMTSLTASGLHTGNNVLEIVYISLLGRILEHPTLEELESFAGRTKSRLRQIRNLINIIRLQRKSEKKAKEWGQRLRNGYKVPERSSARAQWESIDSHLNNYYFCWIDTVAGCTNKSVGDTFALMKTLRKHASYETNELCAVVSQLLSSCHNVFSADVPTALRRLVDDLKASESQRQQFLAMSDDEASEWLLGENSGSAGIAFRDFLQRHGHRCVREAEFRELPWRLDPTRLVSVLRAILESGVQATKEKECPSDAEAVDSLGLSLSWFQRRFLMWMVGRARSSVGEREWGKSVAIHMVDVFREAYRRLGSLMVTEGILPDADFLFFLSHNELGQLLRQNRTEAAHLLNRARNRRRIYPKQMALTFPEVCEGQPCPIETSVTSHDKGETARQIKGMPVSCGRVQGPARVVRSLAEATQIRRGEIMVVPYTDIGWTPYFPLIIGLITEKGGMMSHGAVVAREYGLPCIVACHRATEIVKSGDWIELDGSSGTLEIITTAKE